MNKMTIPTKNRKLSAFSLLLSLCIMLAACQAPERDHYLVPAIFIEGYQYLSVQDGSPEGYDYQLTSTPVYLGSVQKVIPSEAMPKENFVSNIPGSLNGKVYGEEGVTDDLGRYRWIFLEREDGTMWLFDRYDMCVSTAQATVCWNEIFYTGYGDPLFAFEELERVCDLQKVDVKPSQCLPLAFLNGVGYQEGNVNFPFLLDAEYYQPKDNQDVLVVRTKHYGIGDCLFLWRRWDGTERKDVELPSCRLIYNGKIFTQRGFYETETLENIQREKGTNQMPVGTGKRISTIIPIDETPEEELSCNYRNLKGREIHLLEDEPATLWIPYTDYKGMDGYLRFWVGMYF